MARLFIAVWPPEDVVDELSLLQRTDQQGVRFVAPEAWHITMRFLGEADPEEVTTALNGCVLAAARAHVGPAVTVVSRRTLVVPVAGLDALGDAVARLTGQIGELPRRRFVGHLTLARLKPHAPVPGALGAPVDAAFDVSEIALVRSRLDPQGVRYETIETWSVANDIQGCR